MSDSEAMAFYLAGADDLIWRLANRDDLPFSGINDVLKTPATILFQAEIMADTKDRLYRRQEIKAAIQQAQRVTNGRK